MKAKITVILTLFLALVVQTSFAQHKTVSGTVTDSASMLGGGVLPDVNILLKGTKKGTQTNFDGKYTLKTKKGDVLIFSFQGMKTVQKIVGYSNTINISMVEDKNILDEVVVLGYNTRRKNELTGSSIQIKSDKISGSPIASVDQALQGKVAGLAISGTSGTPGTVQDIIGLEGLALLLLVTLHYMW